MEKATLTKEEFEKYLRKHNWNKDYHYCTKVIEFVVDDKVIAKVEFDAIRKASKFYVKGKGLK